MQLAFFFLVVCVDDIVITESDIAEISSLKSFLHSQFHTKNLDALKCFLGVEVTRSKKAFLLSERKYVIDLLTKTYKLEAKPCNTPMTSNMQLIKDGELFEYQGRYRRLVGKLNYLTVTRPDIAYSVSVLSQFMSSPIVHHWVALEKILCYFKGTTGRGIFYSNNDILELCFFKMQIGQVPKLIKGILQAIVCLLVEILSHVRVRNKMFFLDLV